MRQPTRPMPRSIQLQVVEPAVNGLMYDRAVMNPVSGSAEALENWIPTQRGMRVRGGLQASGKLSGAVTSLFTYEAGASSKMFAASTSGVWDVSSVTGDTLAQSGFAGQTAGYYSTAQIGTSGGDFLYAVNGADLAWLYDGSGWDPVGAVQYNELEFERLSTPWAVGDTVTGAISGASADVVGVEYDDPWSGRLILGTITSGPFQSAEQISTSSASAGRNLFLRTEEFDNAWWETPGTPGASIAANDIAAPDGNTTADKIVEGTGTEAQYLRPSGTISVTSGTTYTFSIYAKADEVSFIQLVLQSEAFGSTLIATFDLGNGLTAVRAGATSIITHVGDGWYRCSITAPATASAATRFQIRLAQSISTDAASYTGDGSSGAHIWGAQLEAASAPSAYEWVSSAAQTDVQSTASAASTTGSAVTITGVATSALSAVWLYRNRLFFVEKDTLKAWYLPAAAIGGAAASLSLAGVFQKGGSLLFGATWSLDSGDGLDDKCVFVSTNGEVAVYEGSDPSSSTTWNLVGRYDTARPLGINATMQAGGDLLIATVDGIIPLSQIIQKDPAALSLSAVTRRIETLWMRETADATSPIEIIKWSDEGLGLVTLPDSDKCLIANLQTGAWSTATGWVANCATTFAGKAYIGRDDGRVLAIDETGLDYDEPFVARYCGPFFDFGDPLSHKQGQLMRVAYFAPYEVTFRMSMAANYAASFPSAPEGTNSVNLADYLVWDSGNWDEKLWWSESVEAPTDIYLTPWRTVTKTGTVLAPCLQVTSGRAAKVICEVARIDIGYEAGRAVA